MYPLSETFLAHFTPVTLIFDPVTPRSIGFLCYPGWMCEPSLKVGQDALKLLIGNKKVTERWTDHVQSNMPSFLRGGGGIKNPDTYCTSPGDGLPILATLGLTPPPELSESASSSPKVSWVYWFSLRCSINSSTLAWRTCCCWCCCPVVLGIESFCQNIEPY